MGQKGNFWKHRHAATNVCTTSYSIWTAMLRGTAGQHSPLSRLAVSTSAQWCVNMMRSCNYPISSKPRTLLSFQWSFCCCCCCCFCWWRYSSCLVIFILFCSAGCFCWIFYFVLVFCLFGFCVFCLFVCFSFYLFFFFGGWLGWGQGYEDQGATGLNTVVTQIETTPSIRPDPVYSEE